METADINLPRVIKKDNSREDFSEKKIELGILRALNKRSVDKGSIDIAIQNIINKLKTITDKEIISSQIGVLVMQELRELDQVAYIIRSNKSKSKAEDRIVEALEAQGFSKSEIKSHCVKFQKKVKDILHYIDVYLKIMDYYKKKYPKNIITISLENLNNDS